MHIMILFKMFKFLNIKVNVVRYRMLIPKCHIMRANSTWHWNVSSL